MDDFNVVGIFVGFDDRDIDGDIDKDVDGLVVSPTVGLEVIDG